MKTLAILILISIGLLAGCSPAQPAIQATDNATASSTGTTAQADQGGEMPQGVVIVFNRSGGFAGVDESWTIYGDGQITMGEGGESQVDAGEIDKVVDELTKLGFFEMQNSYVPLDTCCDRFTYKLEVTAEGKTHSVTALEAAPDAPAELWKAIEAVSGLLQGTK